MTPDAGRMTFTVSLLLWPFSSFFLSAALNGPGCPLFHRYLQTI